MKPAAFAYHAPTDVDELLDLAKSYGASGRALAGGQSLVPLMNARRLRVKHVIDLNCVEGLDGIEVSSDTVEIGAIVRQAEVLRSPDVRGALPLLAEATECIASPAVRNRGTVCGSLVHAMPAAELPAVALAMDGHVLVRHADGDRVIEANSFFDGPYRTALRDGEVVVALRLRRWPVNSGYAFLEANRMRFPIFGVAALVELESGLVSRCAIAVTMAIGAPARLGGVELTLLGEEPSDATIDAAVTAGGREIAAVVPRGARLTDYTISLARGLVPRAIRLAVDRATTKP